MLAQPESNVKFTDDQTAQIDAWKRRVFVAQEELSLKEARLNELKVESIRILKDLEYNRGLLVETSFHVDVSKKELEELNRTIVSTLSELALLKQQKLEIYNSNNIKKTELTQRETVLNDKEKLSIAHTQEGEKRLLHATEKEAAINNAEKKLREAINNIWK